MIQKPVEQPRQKIPKDGPGPRGGVDCYYTSRVLESTHRYVKFVKKLRATEEEQRRGEANKLQALKDVQNSDFFIRCDRRALINNVARRVDLCLLSYEEDLKEKRKRLVELLKLEEEANIRKFVEQAQSGAELVWQDKLARLQHLIEKRKKEHEEKYKDTPLSKCAHVLPCIVKLRAKECEEIQLYQMKEKQARKMAEKEIDKMWHDVVMKETEALEARIEIDTIERLRRDQECKRHSDYELEQRRLQREQQREYLKQEAKWFRKLWDDDIKKEEEAERKRTEKRLATAAERKRMIEERHEEVKRLAEEQRLINETWDSLAGQGLQAEHAHVQYMRKKERDLDECNRQMIALRAQIGEMERATDEKVAIDAQLQQKIVDQKRCDYLGWAQRTNREVRKAMIKQIEDRKNAREELKKKMLEQDEYERQVFNQTEQLMANQLKVEAEKRKAHQKNLVAQIEYNKLLKERALQEEMEQRQKAKEATEEYQREVERMLARPFYSDDVHSFMKQMATGLKMKQKCPCSKQDYCKNCNK